MHLQIIILWPFFFRSFDEYYIGLTISNRLQKKGNFQFGQGRHFFSGLTCQYSGNIQSIDLLKSHKIRNEPFYTILHCNILAKIEN